MQELSEFVAASWAELLDDGSGTAYFYNQVPDQAPLASSTCLIEDATQACLIGALAA